MNVHLKIDPSGSLLCIVMTYASHGSGRDGEATAPSSDEPHWYQASVEFLTVFTSKQKMLEQAYQYDLVFAVLQVDLNELFY